MGLYTGYVIKPKEHSEPLWVDSGDKMHTPKPTRMILIYCGCGSISSRVRAILEHAKIIDVDQVKISYSVELQRYIALNNLTKIIPSLSGGVYAVLHNPKTGSFLDLNDTTRSVDELAKIAYKMGKGKI